MPKKIVDKEALKAFRQKLDDKYVIEGEYSPETSVGEADAANNLTPYSDNSGAEGHNPFVFQSAGNGSDVGSLAQLRALRGNTVAFNQLVDSETTSVDLISDRKYITDISGVRSLVTGDGSSVNVTGGTDQVFDLTLMFGAGKEPTTVLEFNRLFPEPYYEYNAGELLSCKSNSYKVVGYNQFDGELEQGFVNGSGTLVNNDPNSVITKNYIRVIAGQEYSASVIATGYNTFSIVEYDANHNFIKRTGYITESISGHELTSNTSYIKVYLYFNSATNTDAVSELCVHLTYDGTKTGYEPYESKTYILPNVELRSAGSVYDELKPNGTLIRRLGIVDLGTLNWSYQGVFAQGFGVYVIDGLGSTNGIVANAICAKYQVVNTGDTTTDKSIRLHYVNSSYPCLLEVIDTDYTDATTFKQSLSGVYLVYELATPTTTQSAPFAENTDINNWGTQEFIGNGVPQGNSFFYAVDYKAFIDSLGNREDIEFDASQLVSQTQLAQVGGVDLTAVDSNIIPETDNTYDIGSSSKAWKDLYIKGKLNKNSNGYSLTLPSTASLTTDSELLDTASDQTITGLKNIKGQLDFTLQSSNPNNIKWSIKNSGEGDLDIFRGNTRYARMSLFNFRPIGNTDLGSATNRWKNLYLSGNITNGTNSVTVADISNGLLNVINAADITPSGSNFQLTQAQYDLITNGKITIIKGTLGAYVNNIILLTGLIDGTIWYGSCASCNYGHNRINGYLINPSTLILTFGRNTGSRIELEGERLNGKTIPAYPSNTGTYVMKCINGVLTWVQE